jgi:transposase
MISVISNSGKLYFHVYTGKFDSKVFIEFLKRLITQIKGKVFLILDNLSVHKSKKVTKWVNNHKTRIELFFLPPYSPDLNPDEFLNNDLKSTIYKEKRPGDRKELKSMLVNKMKSFQKKSEKIKSYFKAEKLSYTMVA